MDHRPQRQIWSWLLGVFFISTVLVPAAAINKVVFVAMAALMIVTSVMSFDKLAVKTFSPLLILTIFLYGYVMSLANNADRELSTQFMLSVATLVLIYPIDWNRIDLDGVAKLSGLVMAAATVTYFFLIIVISDSQLSGPLFDYFVKYSIGGSGERELSDDSPFMLFHLGAAPFLFLPFSLFVDSFLSNRKARDLLAAIALAVVMVTTTSRGLISICLAAVAYLVIRKVRPETQAVLLCLGALATIVLVEYLLSNTNVFSLRDPSNSIKFGHAMSFFDNMSIGKALFGEGLAAYYFSAGRNAYVAHTEITQMDMARYFGIVPAVVLYAALMFPSGDLSTYRRGNSKYVVLFLLYLVMSLTNPVLFNSYGLLVVLWYWSKVLVVGSGVDPRALRENGVSGAMGR